MIAFGRFLRSSLCMVFPAKAFDARGCLQAMTEIESDLKELASTLTEAQFHAPPRTGGWSVGHCIEHLVLTGQAFFSRWDTALKDGSTKRAFGSPNRYRWWQRRLLSLAEPPYKLKTKTRQVFLPCSHRPMKETLLRFFEMHQELARRLTTSSGLDLRDAKVQSPFVSWIWYPVGFSFDLALAHERRHIWQARQVRRQLMNEF